MQSKVGAIVISLAILIGLLGGTAAYRAMSTQQAGAVTIETVPVVIATRDIAPGEKLTRKDLTVTQFPAENLPAAYASDPETIGKLYELLSAYF